MLNCPNCAQASLAAITDPQTKLEIDSCERCLGIWFDGQELSRFFPSHTLAGKLSSRDATGVQPQQQNPERQCPRCATQLVTVKAADVELDRCRECRGIWFDHGELDILMEKARGGLRGDPEVVHQVTMGLTLDSAKSIEEERREQVHALCQFLAII